MGIRGPKQVQKTAKVSANIPVWKRDILDTLGIHPTYAINTGIDLVLEDVIKSGRISQDGIQVYIESLERQASAIQEKIRTTQAILQDKAITQHPGQLRVWDKVSEEVEIIPASRYDKSIHVIREVLA